MEKMELFTAISLRVRGYDLMHSEKITDARCREVMEAYKAGAVNLEAPDSVKLAACFMFQRSLCKWGGDMLGMTNPAHRAWRQLMLETAHIDPVPFPDESYGRPWNRLTPAEKESVQEGIRQELAATAYEAVEVKDGPIQPDAVHMHVKVHHAYWVVPGRFLAGEYPNEKWAESAPPILRSLMDAGVACFIDLTEEGELDPYDRFLEGQEHLRFPILDVSVPKSKNEMRAILDAIDERLDSGKGVYVHCWGGVGRTGTVVGCWLARHGETMPLEKLQELWQPSCKAVQGRHCPETDEQRRFITAWKAGE